MRLLKFAALIASLIIAAPAIAEPDFPKLTGPVVDLANEIPDDREAKLSADLLAWQKQTGHQLVVVTIPSLDGQVIEEYGYKLGRHWGIGRKGVNDGILLIHSPGDRKVRIEVGRGAEPYLTDALSSTIMRGTIIPAFKQDRFADGIVDGAAEIMKEAAITPEQRAEDDRKAADARRIAAQKAWDAFTGFLFWAFLTFLGVAALFAIYWIATAPRRARERAAEAARLKARQEEAARLEAKRQKERIEAERRRQAEALRLRQEREAMLAAMTPAKRKAFLAEEDRQRRAAEAAAAERERVARIARQRREAEEAAAEEKRRTERRASESSNSSTNWSAPSPSPSPTESYGGGGGDFGGGGSTGDY